MSQKQYIIYIPGLGDSKVAGQQKAVSLWRLHGIQPFLFQMNWADGEGFQAKLDRLLMQVDNARADGFDVSLVAASAGAGAALNAFCRQPDSISGVVCICGQILGSDHVSSGTYKNNTAFKESMEMLPKSLDLLGVAERRRILSLHPIADPIVPVRDTRLPGCIEGKLPTTGHAVSIAYALTVGSWRIMKFLRVQTAKRIV